MTTHNGNRSLTKAFLAGTIAFSACMVVAQQGAFGNRTVGKASGSAVSISEINPDTSTSSDPDGASGGRINALAAGGARVYAASEWGGLFVSDDLGEHWAHLDGHSPAATWRVQVDPTNPTHIYATSLYDGRTNSLAGINVSTDAGKTWTHPAVATPPTLTCVDSSRISEPAALGISVDPDNPDNIYVGTNCGIVMSSDHGKTWRRIDPTPSDPADTVWDIVIHHHGIVDACGDDGHLRLTNDGGKWTVNDTLPSGQCSLAVSPDEPNTIFTTVGKQIYESDDAGKTWVATPDPQYQGRIPVLKANKLGDQRFNLWFGDVILYRAECTTPSSSDANSLRCPSSDQWTVLNTREAGGHDDIGDILFASSSGENCPLMFSSDGGVFLNTVHQSPDCQTPRWRQPAVTPHALWVFSLDAAPNPKANTLELYFANQDNGVFYTSDAQAVKPLWTNPICCDSFDVLASADYVIYSSCCYGECRGNRLFISDRELEHPTEIAAYPLGQVPGWQHASTVVQVSDGSYALVTDGGEFVTPNINATNQTIETMLRWNTIEGTSLPGQCGIYLSTPANADPVFFIQTENCDGKRPARLFKHIGFAGSTGWKEVHKPFPDGGFGLVSVSRSNPNFIVASYIKGANGEPHMVSSSDGGSSWHVIKELDSLMTQNGLFVYRSLTGPSDFAFSGGYIQPTLVAIDPADPRFVVAGGADSGLFFSEDGGLTWTTLTSPAVNGKHGGFLVPRPRVASFAHDGSILRLFVGTQGRGVWRFTIDIGH